MLPVAIAMIGTHARIPTIAFVGWFGPRGLASIVFGVVVVDAAGLPHTATLTVAIAVTVALSVLAHGLTAQPLAARYAAWCSSSCRSWTRPNGKHSDTNRNVGAPTPANVKPPHNQHANPDSFGGRAMRDDPDLI